MRKAAKGSLKLQEAELLPDDELCEPIEIYRKCMREVCQREPVLAMRLVPIPGELAYCEERFPTTRPDCEICRDDQ